MKVEIIKLLSIRGLAVILIAVGVSSEKYGFHFLLTSGALLGAYYGWFNDIIWRPNGKLESSLPYRAHQVWVHVICGIVGSLAFYLLVRTIDIRHPLQTVEKLGIGHLILFVIGVLGYTGLLPRILWFSTYAKQDIK